MILGGYTFPLNPEISFGILKKKKHCAVVETYSSIAYFSWGSSFIGKEIEINWPWMDEAQYFALQDLMENDIQLVFDPTGTNSFKFNVNIMELDGKYWLKVLADDNGNPVYKDVKLKMVIMSEA